VKFLSIIILFVAALWMGAKLFYPNQGIEQRYALQEIQEEMAGRRTKGMKMLALWHRQNIHRLSDLADIVQKRHLGRSAPLPALKRVRSAKEYELLLSELEFKEIEFKESFNSANYSISQIRALQQQIAAYKSQLEMETGNLDSWGPRLIFYLMMVEGMDLDEIDQLSHQDYQLSGIEWKRVSKQLFSAEFSESIKQYQQSGEVNFSPTTSAGRLPAASNSDSNSNQEDDDFVDKDLPESSNPSYNDVLSPDVMEEEEPQGVQENDE
jgi:hypothetical protein